MPPRTESGPKLLALALAESVFLPPKEVSAAEIDRSPPDKHPSCLLVPGHGLEKAI